MRIIAPGARGRISASRLDPGLPDSLRDERWGSSGAEEAATARIAAVMDLDSPREDDLVALQGPGERHRPVAVGDQGLERDLVSAHRAVSYWDGADRGLNQLSGNAAALYGEVEKNPVLRTRNLGFPGSRKRGVLLSTTRNSSAGCRRARGGRAPRSSARAAPAPPRSDSSTFADTSSPATSPASPSTAHPSRWWRRA
jgi:hypothetical protein